MIETNIKIVYPGQQLYITTRRAIVQGTHYTPDLLEKCCGKLRYQHGLAAVPHPTQKESLLVASYTPIKSVHLEDEDWELNVVDADEEAKKYTLKDIQGQDILPKLVERALLVTMKTKTDLWNFDSPRFWYEEEPYRRSNGFVAYRRYEISGIYVEDAGVGVVVDVGMAFFTENTLEYYFAQDISSEEQKKRRKEFNLLRKRHGDDLQGTLLYDHGDGCSKCYFCEANGTTCETTGMVKVKGKPYTSLSDYYRKEKQNIVFSDDTPVIRVSFDKISKSQPVAANRVQLRVMNDALPRELRDIDKIDPDIRRQRILDFWKSLGPKPFGSVAPGVFHNELWRPSEDAHYLFQMPDLAYGDNHILTAPKVTDDSAYSRNYRQRIQFLDKYGCYYVPPDMKRILYCVYPEHSNADIDQLCDDFSHIISEWTGNNIEVQPYAYSDIADACHQLRREAQSGVAIFVLNDETNAYHEAAYQLANWRIKRITQNVLEQKHQQLREGAWDRKSRKKTLIQGKRQWDNFIKMNCLEVVQLMDTVPYRTVQTGEYDAQLIIDVGYDRRYFALSLLICRDKDKTPDFILRSEPYRKPDHRRQTINPIILADEIEKLFCRLKDYFDQFDPLNSILVIRDGYFYGMFVDEEYKHETTGVQQAVERLKTQRVVTDDCDVSLISLQKDSLKGIRIWDVDQDGHASNPLEGSAVRIDEKTLVVTTTGKATLRQGTAQPYILRGNGLISGINSVGESTFISAQLNWSSPTVAQRLLLPLKRTDEELKARSSQEVRRYQ
jgi:hypothetical protein